MKGKIGVKFSGNTLTVEASVQLICLLYFLLLYVYFSLAGNKIVYTPSQGTNK